MRYHKNKNFGIRNLDISRKHCLQRMRVWLIPPEGSCVVGCDISADGVTSFTIHSLTPGQDYEVRLYSISYGKESSEPHTFHQVNLL